MSEEEKINQPVDDSQPLTEENKTAEQQQTEHMEVHKHPHHVTHKKKWGEYLLEFLMLFLAVYLGFVAENIREHNVEKKNEKEMIAALYNDIKVDTSNLNIIINKYMPEHENWEDSAQIFISSLQIKGNEKKIARAMMNATNWNLYVPPQVSFDILKSSGNFKFISNENVKHGIIKMNSLLNNYIIYSQFVVATEHLVDTTTAGIIPRRPLQYLIAKAYEKTNASYGSITGEDVPEITMFKTYDKARFDNFLQKIDQVDYLLHDLFGLYKSILKEETILVDLLNKEYDLDNE
ncbi:MAG: hypothetical protein ABIO32_03785 [Ferruginibacter sp.]